MTAVASPPAPDTTSVPAAPRSTADRHDGGESEPERPTPGLQLGAELALALLTITSVLGFARLFDGFDFLGPMVSTAVVAHALLMLARRRGLGLALSAVGSIVAAALLTAWTFYLSSTVLGVPARGTLSELGDDLDRAWGLFRDVVAPAPAETGFVVVSCLAVWIAVFLADWAGFRLWSTAEAVVPTATLFIFASMLGSANHRLTTTGLFLGALLGFVLLHRTARQEGTAGWLGGNARGVGSVLASGVFVAVGAIVIGLLVGPLLPGADGDALIAWRDLDEGGGSRVTLSPMVDIRKRIVDQADVEVFTVTSSERSYWRLTSLDTFDGTIWKSRGDYEDAGGQLPEAVPSSAETVNVEQEFEIAALSSLWLPAAYRPAAIVAPDTDIVYEAASATLIVGSDLDSSDGLAYRVVSENPRFDVATLEAVEREIPPAIEERYLDLPPGFSTEVADLADEITAEAESPYQQALALQDYFRDNFTYNLEVEPGHSEDAIASFLESREGYCEQFAGTYAAMARSLGLPARVAVGFTPGLVDPDDPELYHVRGENAHAWPEVFLAGQGWVAFEPTPTRGIPSAESYTGVPEPPPETTTGETAPTTPVPSTTPLGATPTSTAPIDPDAFAGVTTQGEQAEPPGSPWPMRAAATAAAVIGTLLVYAAVVIATKRARRSRRRRAAVEPAQQVRACWLESIEAATVAGVRRLPTETHREFVERLCVRLPVEPAVVDQLAWAVSAADYSQDGPTTAQVEAAHAAAATIEEAVRSCTSRLDRIRAALDPRPLLPHRRTRVVEDRTVQARAV